jgi:hypothetical protein
MDAEKGTAIDSAELESPLRSDKGIMIASKIGQSPATIATTI